jgi:hypothetical protein
MFRFNPSNLIESTVWGLVPFFLLETQETRRKQEYVSKWLCVPLIQKQQSRTHVLVLVLDSRKRRSHNFLVSRSIPVLDISSPPRCSFRSSFTRLPDGKDARCSNAAAAVSLASTIRFWPKYWPGFDSYRVQCMDIVVNLDSAQCVS